MVSIEVLYQIKVQLVIDRSTRVKKNETLKIWLKYIYTHFLTSYFSRFLKFISSLGKNCCMHFNISEQDSPNRIEPDSYIL